jgi:signal transduction histidine kinase
VTGHEIHPKQLRALLLLLVLVPLIPTALMLRFMVDAVQAERGVAREKLAGSYQQTLAAADAAFARQMSNRSTPPAPREVHNFYRGLLDQEVVVRVAEANGKPLTGISVPPREVLVQSSLRPLGLPWVVQVYLLDETVVDSLARQQSQVFAWTAGVAVVAIFGIAAAAALTVHQQLTLRELKSTSVATVAHELRTPLASMRMLVDTLREGRYRSPEQLSEYLELIAGENLRLSRLTENFLTLSRLERRAHGFTIAPVEPEEVARAAVQMLEAQLRAPGCEFLLDAPPDLPRVSADRDALLTVLLNLLENALKYTGDEKQIVLRIAADGAHVRFAVEDNGVGLSASERRQIFRPFYQVDQKLSRSQGGCGLGLSIVQEIVSAHRGKLQVDSEPGRGSTFTISLPAVTRIT